MTAKPPTDLPGTQIYNGQNWAINSATSILERSPGTVIIFNNPSYLEQDTDLWLVRNYREGYRILNMGSKNWASVSGDEVLGVPDFDGDTCKWLIEYTGEGEEFWIRLPEPGGAVWTVKPATERAQSTVILDTLNEQNADQRFTFAVPP